MTAIMLAAQLALSVPACPSVQPSPAFVCVNGGWLPPGHPGIPKAVEPPTPPPGPTQPVVVGFRPGTTYRRDATGALLHITSVGALKNGIAVVAAECLNESTQDQCFFAGQGRFILANANTLGWTEQP
jgi:hypothetical protein